MNIHGIVAVSGRPGLWKALAQNKTGFILESLDGKKTKLVVNAATAKIAALDEITIFGTDDDLKLTDIFETMKTSAAAPDVKADGKKLREYFYDVSPEHDEERVYSSDIKKVITWYNILKDRPEFAEEPKQPEIRSEEQVAAEAEEPVTAEAEAAAPTATAKKKAK